MWSDGRTENTHFSTGKGNENNELGTDFFVHK
jgi:hypothetical protein